MSDSLQLFGLLLARLLCPWDFQARILKWAVIFLLQGIFHTQRLNPHRLCLLHCRKVLYLLIHQGSPDLLCALLCLVAPALGKHLLSVSIDLPSMDLSYEWNHTVYDLWCLASFTQYNVCKIPLLWSMHQYFIPCYGWIIFHWWTGRPGVLRFMGSQRAGHDWATELNWTEYSIVWI